ncbi:Co2+/Mg2+ efflux protein ApaG [Acidocella facilis]|uniref:Co2+/Mg2+ efflux protein ApaG n=1 Tax=Acidocella facilis TaxID=525 RepID=UPI0004792393|nr:Co2+/Mg2+ efflux protein ApaG [Acidocella facilis]
MEPGFEATTNDVTVQVRVMFLDEQSQPEAGRFFWAYHISIINQGGATVQLLRRTWHITDSTGYTHVVHGDGVVGEQPVLTPGARFEYSSGAPLATASGFMVGTYHMQRLPGGEPFDVAVPAFSLDSPHEDPRRH